MNIGRSSAGCHTVRRLLEGCKGLQEAGWADVSCENWLSSLVTPTVHRRRCRSSRSVREKFCRGEKRGFGSVPKTRASAWEASGALSQTHLVTAIALVWLLSAVHSLVSVQVVALDESHVARIAGKRLLPWKQATVIHSSSQQTLHHIKQEPFVLFFCPFYSVPSQHI